jgi:Arc/MetJ-type ribon-helix-helix transcriptional regulator
MVQLTADLVNELDAEADERGMSRSAVIREAVEAHLAEHREDAIGRAIAEGYRRIPPATPDGWSDLETTADVEGHALAQRLDAEERAAGLDQW